MPGLGDADGNISYSEPRDPVDAWEMRQLWCDQMGIDPTTLVTAHQVHGNQVGVVPQAKAGTGSAPGTGLFGKFDSLVTNEPNVAVMMTHADCLAVILCDPQTRSVGVVHAGWRGTVVQCQWRGGANDDRARSDPVPRRSWRSSDPAFASDCYSVGDEVVDAWRARDAGERRIGNFTSEWTVAFRSG